MLDIDNHKDDPMLVEFSKRRAQGTPSPRDIANAALLNASQAATVLSEAEDETVIEDAEDTLDRVQLAVQAVATAERQGDKALAAGFAQVAETEALVLDTFDYVKVDGLRRHEIHSV